MKATLENAAESRRTESEAGEGLSEPRTRPCDRARSAAGVTGENWVCFPTGQRSRCGPCAPGRGLSLLMLKAVTATLLFAERIICYVQGASTMLVSSVTRYTLHWNLGQVLWWRTPGAKGSGAGRGRATCLRWSC